MTKLCLFVIQVVTFLIFLGGCSTISNAIGSLKGSSKTSSLDNSDEMAIYDDGIPRVRPGVVVSIQVGVASQKPVVTQAQVDENGEITLQYLLESPILCNGLTLDALKQKLIKAYQVYIKQPVVSVAFVPVDGNNGVSPYGTVTVLGEVVQPGPVNMPATMNLTVTKALKLAGGVRPFADKEAIRVTRCDKNGEKKRTIVNLKEIGKEGLIHKDITLRAGDVVWVPETWY